MSKNNNFPHAVLTPLPPTRPTAATLHARAATPAKITETNRQYLANQREFQIFTTTKAQLKRQILAAVPPTFTNALNDRTLGFANVTTFAILTHLTTTYGTITTDDLDRNMALLHRDWSPSEPIENLFEQICQCREFAADEDPISEAMALRAGLMTLEKFGLFNDAIRDWRKRAPPTKTLANFAIDFKLADGERQ
jgi:hypothetical protein